MMNAIETYDWDKLCQDWRLMINDTHRSIMDQDFTSFDISMRQSAVLYRESTKAFCLEMDKKTRSELKELISQWQSISPMIRGWQSKIKNEMEQEHKQGQKRKKLKRSYQNKSTITGNIYRGQAQ